MVVDVDKPEKTLPDPEIAVVTIAMREEVREDFRLTVPEFAFLEIIVVGFGVVMVAKITDCSKDLCLFDSTILRCHTVIE